MRNAGLMLALLVAAGSAGAQWEILPSGSTADLRGIDNAGKVIAWASGSEGTVLRTTDDGAHWQRCATPPGAEHLDFRGIQAFDANTAIVMSSGKGPLSRLYKTTDACQSWKLLFTNPDPDGFWDAFWLNAMYGEGMLLGDPVRGQFTIMETEDGGTTWKRDRSKSLRLKGTSFTAFAASNSSIGKANRGNGDTRGPGIDYFPGFVTGGGDGSFLIERWQGRSRTKARFSGGLYGSWFQVPDWNRRAIP